METYLSLDFGGTKLLIGEVDRSGNILKHKRYDTGYMSQQEAGELIRRSLADYVSSVGWATGEKPRGVGMGIPGRVNCDEGLWMQFDPARTETVPLAAILSEITGLPAYVNNDVKAATLAEQLWGYGRKYRNFIYINVGTGLAAGTVVNGQFLIGTHYNAGEIGHSVVGTRHGVACCCGRTDCVETIVSGVGFDFSARALRDKYQTALHISDNPDCRVSVREIYDLYAEGDPLATVLVDDAAQALADLVMNMVRFSDPEIIVLGGGILSSGFLFGKMKECLNPTTLRFLTGGVVMTELNPDYIGLLGAAAVAIQQ